jgi:Winged helix-turn-helix DNA-binding
MPSTRERLLALVKADPNITKAQIAERLGVTRQRIKQLADAEGLSIADGIAGRKPGPQKRATAEAAPVTGGIASIPPGTSPAVAILLAAADLTARGFSVYLPFATTAAADLVTIDTHGRVERVSVARARRAGGEVRYDDPDRGGVDRRALILSEEPVQYSPALGKAAKRRKPTLTRE